MSSFDQANSPFSSGGDSLRFTPEQKADNPYTHYDSQFLTTYQTSANYYTPDVNALLAELAQLKEERRADVTRDLHLRAQLSATTNAAAERERDLTEQIGLLQTELSMRPQVEDFERLMTSWRNANENASTTQQQLNFECNTLREHVSEPNRDLAAAQERVRSVEASVQDIPCKLHDQGIQIANLKSDVVRVRSQVEEAERRELETQRELVATHVEAQRIPGLDESLGRWKARAELSETRLQQLTAEAASSRLQAERLTELELVLKQRNAQASALETRTRGLEKDNVALRQSVTASLAQIAELTSRAEAAEGSAGQLKTENQDLRSRVNSVEADFKSQANAMVEKSLQMCNELVNLRSRAKNVSALEATVVHLRSQVERTTGLEGAFEQLRAKAQQVDRYAKQLEDECASLRQTADHLQHLQNETMVLRSQQNHAEKTQRELVARAEAAEQNASHLEAEAQTLRGRAQIAETALAEAARRLEDMEGYLRRCDEKAATLAADVHALRAARAEVDLKVASPDSRDERLQSERESLMERMRELLPFDAGTELSDASEVLRAIESEFERLRDRTSAVELQLADLENRYDARGRSYTVLRARLAEVGRNAWRF